MTAYESPARIDLLPGNVVNVTHHERGSNYASAEKDLLQRLFYGASSVVPAVSGWRGGPGRRAPGGPPLGMLSSRASPAVGVSLFFSHPVTTRTVNRSGRIVTPAMNFLNIGHPS